MCRYVLNDATHSFGARLQSLAIVAGTSLAFIVLLVFSLIYDNMWVMLTEYRWANLLLVFWLGFGTARYLVLHDRTDGRHSKLENAFSCYLTPWKVTFIEVIINN